MRFSTCTFIVLSLGSAVVPSIALPTYPRAYPSYISARDNLIAREIAQSLIPEDESGALSAQQVKDFGKKAWQKTKQIAKVAAPYALQLAPLALALREEPELWARLDARSQEILRRELETVPAVDDSGALSWDQVKDAGKKTFQGVSSFVQEAAPYIVDGIHIAQAIKGKSATPPRELLTREDILDELLARALLEVD